MRTIRLFSARHYGKERMNVAASFPSPHFDILLPPEGGSALPRSLVIYDMPYDCCAVQVTKMKFKRQVSQSHEHSRKVAYYTKTTKPRPSYDVKLPSLGVWGGDFKWLDGSSFFQHPFNLQRGAKNRRYQGCLDSHTGRGRS